MRSHPNRRKKIAVVVSRADGTVDDVNDTAKALLGFDCTGAACWDAIGGRLLGEAVPCNTGCVGRLVAAGHAHAAGHRVSLDGRSYELACAPVGDRTVSVLTPSAAAPRDGGRALSAREREVLRALSRGATLRRVAESLSISVPTVRTHVEHLRRKLGVTTQAALVTIGFARGYLP